MSIVNVVAHDENIYDILYVPPPPRPKSPMYVSEREKQLKKQKIPKTHATMGYADVPLKPPECFLQKGHGIHPPPKEPPKIRCLTSVRRPPIPKPCTAIKHKENTNFRIENIKKVIHLKPPIPEKKLVDTPKGHILDANEKKFKCVYHKKFGTVPKYLLRQNREIKKSEEEYRFQLENQEPLCKPISPEERSELLDGLKQNWAEMQKSFLLLPMLTDTIPKVIKKKKMEEQLRQLEKDIKMIELNPYIYIYD